jgi:hypothetical protein
MLTCKLSSRPNSYVNSINNNKEDLLIAMMMEAARTSETLVNFYQTALRYNPEDSHLLNKEDCYVY